MTADEHLFLIQSIRFYLRYLQEQEDEYFASFS